MKLRSDFVTNSSSSSFVIARHNDCTYDEIKTMLNRHRDDILSILECGDGYVDCEYTEEIQSYYDEKNFNKAIDLAIVCLAGELTHDGWNSMRLGEWIVNAAYGSNEDPDLFACMLYDYGHDMGTEHLKIMRGD